MKIIIICFSQTQNTRQISQALADGARNKGAEVELIDWMAIKDVPPETIGSDNINPRKERYSMKLIALTGTTLLILMNAGCTTRNMYEGLRMQQDMECQSLQGANRDECERRSGMSYDEYQRQLKEREKNR